MQLRRFDAHHTRSRRISTLCSTDVRYSRDGWSVRVTGWPGNMYDPASLRLLQNRRKDKGEKYRLQRDCEQGPAGVDGWSILCALLDRLAYYTGSAVTSCDGLILD